MKAFGLAPLLALFVLSSFARSQRCAYQPDNLPNNGGSNVIPFGHLNTNDPRWSKQRYQALVPVAKFGNNVGLICEMAWASYSSRIREFATIQVTFAQTTASKMSTTFAANLVTNKTVVLRATNYTWPTTAGKWTRMGLQKPYNFIPARGNLVVEVIVTGAGSHTGPSNTGFRSISPQPRLYRYGWSSNRPPATGILDSQRGLRMEFCFDTNDLQTFGKSCAGSNGTPALSLGGSAKLGNNFSIDLSGAPGNTGVAILVIGTSALPAPLPLPGSNCHLLISIAPALLFGLPTTNGRATARFPALKTIPICTELYAQYFPLDVRANSLGLSATNYGRILFGN